MASQSTGKMSSTTTRSWRRLDSLPLVVALQGLGLFVLAFLIGAPPPTDQVSGSTAGLAGYASSESVRTASDTRVPADLLPEQIRLPKFPNQDERAPRQQPAPISEDQQEASNPGLNLTALRVDSVAFDAPARRYRWPWLFPTLLRSSYREPFRRRDLAMVREDLGSEVAREDGEGSVCPESAAAAVVLAGEAVRQRLPSSSSNHSAIR